MMDDTLLKAITALGSPKVLLVGDFMLDVCIFANAVKISPHAPTPVLKVVGRQYSCGGAGFVAADIAALGGQAVCVGIIGEDDNGKKLKKMLSETGMDVSSLLPVSDRCTIIKQRIIGLAQQHHRQELMRFDEESTEPIGPLQQQQVLDAYEAGLAAADIVCLQDYNKGLLTAELCGEMITLAISAGKKVLIDPWLMSDYSKYKGATLITPNRAEAGMAIGFEIKTAADAAKAAEQLAGQLGLEVVAITLDKEGIYLKTNDIAEVIPTVPREVYDVSGAGDMILATLAVTTAAGYDYRMGAEVANLAAGIQVGKTGAVSVTVDEIVSEIISQQFGKSGKIRTVEMLLPELNWHRHQGRVIVFTNGCFDILHRGHIEYLTFCKKQGDILVLCLNSDSSVRTIKGPERPVNNQHDRAAVLAGLECIDYITIFDEPDPLELIKKVQPNILVKGADWADKGVIGREFVEECGGKVVLAPLVDGKSSTGTIEKIKSLIKKAIK